MRKFADAALLLFAAVPAQAQTADVPDWLSLHAQTTFVEQYHPAFHSPYRGPNSLAPQSVGDETFDATAFIGVRFWQDGVLYADPEIDQGFGLSNTLGVAGFPSGEAYKVGKEAPYFRLQRAFFRQTFDLGGESQKVDPDANEIGGTRTADNLILTAGKFSVTDVFDTNQYAHDPKQDFLNWALIDSGAFDYAADAWGYSYGGAAEWTRGWWTLRAGLFDLSRVPNSVKLMRGFGQFEAVAEAEERHTLLGRSGKLKVLGFLNRGNMGSYDDAIALAEATHSLPDTALVRRYKSRPGIALNLEQGLTDDLGFFARASLNDGSQEAYEFTEINRSLAAGLALKGTSWSRGDDTLGAAVVVNGMPSAARDYFADGGLGILIGDGRLPHYGSEDILEAYYKAQLWKWLAVSADYQFVARPAYNSDRGPVSVFALRLHGAI
jgi:high affinity Mn2+ porin